jgi:hypothetical protein
MYNMFSGNLQQRFDSAMRNQAQQIAVHVPLGSTATIRQCHAQSVAQAQQTAVHVPLGSTATIRQCHAQSVALGQSQTRYLSLVLRFVLHARQARPQTYRQLHVSRAQPGCTRAILGRVAVRNPQALHGQSHAHGHTPDGGLALTDWSSCPSTRIERYVPASKVLPSFARTPLFSIPVTSPCG